MIRPTQKDIAQRAGVTQATVSLALGRHPSVSSATRTRIEAIAREIGYQPDPYLSGLSAYRKRLRPPHFQGTLAWLSNYPEGETWRDSHVFRAYYEGAAARAGELGYKLEEHRLRTPGMSSLRVQRILEARNISGIMIAPQPRPGMSLDFRFDRFSAATFGYTLAEPQLHIIALQQFRSMETLFRKLIALGYTRPGLSMTIDSDKRADRNWSAAFWSEQRALPTRNRLPLLNDEIDKKSFLAWFERHRPDVVVSLHHNVYDWLKEAGFDVPGEVGVALVTVPDGGAFFSGIWENPHIIGAKAAEFLVDLIHRGECGVPEVPLCLLVAGTWRDGKTVRAQT